MSLNESEVVAKDQSKRSLEDAENEPNKKLCVENHELKEKLPKRKKVAMLLGYSGKNYYGMQINAQFKTVEKELMSAMLKAGLITNKELQDLYLIKFQRAARTDKGVSAASQVVSLLLTERHNIDDINVHLPPDIKVFSIKRVTKGFDSKNNCFGRTYSYTLPTYVLSQNQLDNFLEDDYRIPQETIKRVNDILNSYVGSHNFHNFTSKRAPDDPSSRRYIMTCTCDEPFVHVKEFITFRIKGQSFMLHQIRKMVGAVIAILRGFVPSDFIETSFKVAKTRIPMAPGSGLLLENVHYDKYNSRYGNDGIHDKLTWDDVQDEVNIFKQEKIMKPMLDDEIQNQNIIKWLQELEKSRSELSEVEKVNTDEGTETEVDLMNRQDVSQ